MTRSCVYGWAVLVWAGLGCGGDEPARTVDDANMRPGLAGSGSNSFDGRVPLMPVQSSCAPSCTDFPRAPLFDGEGTAPPMDAASYFGDKDEFTAGVCVLEPQLSEGDAPGALMPRNWLRPRFRWTAAGSEDLWEVRLESEEQANALVAYTTRTTWTLPRELWKSFGEHTAGAPITVTIRGVQRSRRGKPSGMRGSFAVAPTDASGKLVYWATTSSEVRPETSKLVGFDVGDEGVVDALRVTQVGDRRVTVQGGRELRGRNDDPKGVPAGHVQCIGCHVSTPDGEAVAFTDHWPWNGVIASVLEGSAGRQPAYVGTAAERLLGQPWLGMTTFSAAHWSPGDRILVTSFSPRNMDRGGVGFTDAVPYPSRRDGLAWFDLEATGTFSADPSRGDVQQQLNDQVRALSGKAFGLLELTGESRAAVAPSFSRDGRRIVYTSADTVQDGRLGQSNAVDLHVVPWNDRAGGSVTPLRGAAEPGVAEYYPAFSPDDRLVAFTRAKLDGSPVYYRPDGEVYVVPSEGGEAVRLRANDPPACSGQKSPGIINSWPKWSLAVSLLRARTDEFGVDRTHYWVIFSSAREYPGQFTLPRTQYSPSDTRSSQLYMAAVVRNESTQELETFPAVYLWNQDPATSNLTPAWDNFKIPPVMGPD